MRIPTVSVVLAAYNCAAFVDRAIQSALDQDGVDLEIIAVNDQSQDDTLRTLTHCATVDPRLRVIDSDANLGPAGARNLGLSAARGDWIAILDADDALTSGSLRRLAAAADDAEADIIAGAFRFFDYASRTISPPVFEETSALETIDKVRFVEGARPYNGEPDFGLLKPLFRRAFMERHQLRYRERIRHGEDFHLVVDALHAGARYVLKRDLVAYLYTSRNSGLSQTLIDYSSMISETEDLRCAATARGDHDLAAGLKRRSDALRRLELDRMGSIPFKANVRLHMYRRAIRSSVGREWLKNRIARRFG